MNKVPKYKIGDIVLVREQELKEGRIFQGIVESAELIGQESNCWFYGIIVPQSSVDGETKKVFTYQGRCGDATSKIIETNQIDL